MKFIPYLCILKSSDMYIVIMKEKEDVVFYKSLFLNVLGLSSEDLTEFRCSTMETKKINELVVKFNDTAWLKIEDKIEDKITSIVDGELITDYVINYTAKKIRLLFNEAGNLIIK